jgi:hypothetical protein
LLPVCGGLYPFQAELAALEALLVVLAVAALLDLFMVRVEPEAQGEMPATPEAALLVDLLGVTVKAPHGLIPVGLELAEEVLPILMALAAGVAVALLTRQAGVTA